MQGLDRYGYVGNNPIIYTDPSGHCRTDDDPDDCFIAGKDYKKQYSMLIKQHFGIALEGDWSMRNLGNLYDSLSNLNDALPGNIKEYTNGTTYSFTYDSYHYGGITNTSNGNISFWSYGQIPFQNVYHEVAHSINIRSGNYFTDLLRSEKIYTTSGAFVMGGPDIGYSRNSLGYENSIIQDTTGMSVEAEQHTASYNCSERPDWCASGNNADEEFADLVTNYVAGNLITDPTNPNYQFGIARQDWVTSAFTNAP